MALDFVLSSLKETKRPFVFTLSSSVGVILLESIGIVILK